MQEKDSHHVRREEGSKKFRFKKRRTPSLPKTDHKRRWEKEKIEQWWSMSAALSSGDCDQPENLVDQESYAKFTPKKPSMLLVSNFNTVTQAKGSEKEDSYKTCPAKEDERSAFSPNSTICSQLGSSTDDSYMFHSSKEKNRKRQSSDKRREQDSHISEENHQAYSTKEDGASTFSANSISNQAGGSTSDHSYKSNSAKEKKKRRQSSDKRRELDSHITEENHQAYSTKEDGASTFSANSISNQAGSSTSDDSNEMCLSKESEKFSSLAYSSNTSQAGDSINQNFNTCYSSKEKWNPLHSTNFSSHSHYENEKHIYRSPLGNLRRTSLVHNSQRGNQRNSVTKENGLETGLAKENLKSNLSATSSYSHRGENSISEVSYPTRLVSETKRLPFAANSIIDNQSESWISEDCSQLTKRRPMFPFSDEVHKSNQTSPEKPRFSYEKSHGFDQTHNSKTENPNCDSLQALIILENLLRVNRTTPNKHVQHEISQTDELQPKSYGDSLQKKVPTQKLDLIPTINLNKCGHRPKKSEPQDTSNSFQVRITSEELLKNNPASSEKLEQTENSTTVNSISTSRRADQESIPIISSISKKPDDKSKNRIDTPEELVFKTPSNLKEEMDLAGNSAASTSSSFLKRAEEKSISTFSGIPNEVQDRINTPQKFLVETPSLLRERNNMARNSTAVNSVSALRRAEDKHISILSGISQKRHDEVKNRIDTQQEFLLKSPANLQDKNDLAGETTAINSVNASGKLEAEPMSVFTAIPMKPDDETNIQFKSPRKFLLKLLAILKGENDLTGNSTATNSVNASAKSEAEPMSVFTAIPKKPGDDAKKRIDTPQELLFKSPANLKDKNNLEEISTAMSPVNASTGAQVDPISIFTATSKKTNDEMKNRINPRQEFLPNSPANLKEKNDLARNSTAIISANASARAEAEHMSIFKAIPKERGDEAKNRIVTPQEYLLKTPANLKEKNKLIQNSTAVNSLSTLKRAEEESIPIFSGIPEKPDDEARSQGVERSTDDCSNKKTSSNKRKLFITNSRNSESAKGVKSRKSGIGVPSGYQTHLTTEKSRLIFSRSPSKFDDQRVDPAMGDHFSSADDHQSRTKALGGVQTHLTTENSRLIFGKVPGKSQQVPSLNRELSNVTSSSSQACSTSRKPNRDLATCSNEQSKSNQKDNAKIVMFDERQTYLTTVNSRLVFSKNLPVRKSNLEGCKQTDGSEEKELVFSFRRKFEKEPLSAGRQPGKSQNRKRVRFDTGFTEDSEAYKSFRNEQIDILSTPSKSGGFPCLWCKEVFSSAFNQRRHVTKHLSRNEKEYFSCRFCSKKFTRKDHLQCHGYSHRNERPHRCSRCGKRFKYRNSLRRHEKKDSCFKAYMVK